MYKIVTHPGSSHKDDFLATCVLLAALGDADVYRREPTAADMADLNTFVVDVGFEFAPERHNFDHHQDRTLPCASTWSCSISATMRRRCRCLPGIGT